MNTEQAYIEKIDQLYQLQRYQQVIELSMKHLYSEHNYTEYLYTKIIESYLALESLDKAEKIIQEVLSKFPNNNYFYALFARLHLGRMNYFKALEQIDKALKINPNDSYLFYLKGVILNDRSDYKDAKKVIEKALEFSSNNIDYLNIYALVLYNMSDKKYKKVLDQILEIDSNNSEAIYLKGIESKSFFKRNDGLRKALRINPFSQEYQLSFKENKRNFILYIIAFVLTIVNALFILFTNIPQNVTTTITFILFLILVHLSFYLFQAHILATFIILPYLIDMKKDSITLLIIALVLAFVIGYFLRNLATFIKSSINSTIESSKEMKNTIKYLTLKDLPFLIKSNFLKIILFFLVTILLLKEFKDLTMVGVDRILFLLIPFFVLVMRKQFKFILLIQSFILLYIVNLIAGFVIGALGQGQIGNIVVALLMSFIYTETIRRIG